MTNEMLLFVIAVMLIIGFLIVKYLLNNWVLYQYIIEPFLYNLLLLYALSSFIFSNSFIRGGSRYILQGDKWYWVVWLSHKLFGIVILFGVIVFSLSILINVTNFTQNSRNKSNSYRSKYYE